MGEEQNHEDLAVQQAIDQLMASEPGAQPMPVDLEADPALVREYTELLGLLPYALPEERRQARVREQILAQISEPAIQRPFGDITLVGSQPEPVSVDKTLRRIPAASGGPAGKEPGDQTLIGHGQTAAHPVAFPAAAPHPSGSWWPQALAATLAICVFGLGFLSSMVINQRADIGALNIALARSTDPRVMDEYTTLRNNLDMVTGVAEQAYPMRQAVPVGDASEAAQGIVYVCGQHQRWYLNLRGLEPPPSGQQYHLWFMTEDGAVSGGSLDVEQDKPAERDALSMPKGTHGFMVTLEKDGPHDQPEGLQVLLGEQPVPL